MSYIDTIDHEFLGFFAGLPVYRPLATITNAEPNSKEFNCNPTNIIIGGGCGEHPAIVLCLPALAVANFVMSWSVCHPEIIQSHFSGETDGWPDEWDDFIMDSTKASCAEALNFAGWDTADHHRFYELCQSPAMHSPYDRNKSSFNRWLADNLGELIFFCLPELVPDLEKHLPKARQLISEAFYVNILTPPPGMRVSFGRIKSENTLNYGHHRWWPMPQPWADSGKS